MSLAPHNLQPHRFPVPMQEVQQSGGQGCSAQGQQVGSGQVDERLVCGVVVMSYERRGT